MSALDSDLYAERDNANTRAEKAEAEVERWKRHWAGADREWAKDQSKLANIDTLHKPDPDTPTACQCGLTTSCPTRRELDR